jgi:hypothetical protein
VRASSTPCAFGSMGAILPNNRRSEPSAAGEARRTTAPGRRRGLQFGLELMCRARLARRATAAAGTVRPCSERGLDSRRRRRSQSATSLLSALSKENLLQCVTHSRGDLINRRRISAVSTSAQRNEVQFGCPATRRRSARCAGCGDRRHPAANCPNFLPALDRLRAVLRDQGVNAEVSAVLRC